jgi:acyl-CoA thioesterase
VKSGLKNRRNVRPKSVKARETRQEWLTRLKHWFKNDRFAAGCRIELLSVSKGRASAKMMVSREHWNSVGTVMGGAIFTLADFAFAAAANSHANVSVAINANIAFMKAARAGTLWAEAREISKNYKLGSYAVEIRDDEGDLVALFQGMAYRKVEKLPV